MAVVVGGGPAGLSFALELLRNGIDVTLVDSREGYSVCCGGLVSRRTLAYFGKEYAVNRIDGAVIRVGNTEFEVRRRGVAWVLDRERMEREMTEKVREMGGNVLKGYSAFDFSDKSVFVRKGSARILPAKIIVGADGTHSFIRKKLGLETRVLHLAQEERKGEYDPHMVEVELTRDFFRWIIPLNEEVARVGQGSFGDPTRGLEKPCVRDIPLYPPEKRVVYGNVVLAGNAAGHVKATTGGGLYFVAETARLFGRKVVYEDPKLLKEYEKEYQKRIYPVLKAHWRVRKLLWGKPEKMEARVRKFVRKGGPEMLEEKGDFDDPRFLSWLDLIRFL